MTYNLLNYPGSTSAIRNPYFITVLSNTEPDIIVAQEMLSQAGVNEFVSDVLMQVSTDYVAGIFINGSDTDNAIFFKTSLFSFIANIPINTALRDINEFVLMHNATGDTIRIYSLHLKASQGSTNEQKRAAEVDNLRKITDALHPGANFIIAGDFNIYYSNEPAYQKLLNQTNSGYVLDPIDLPGNWHSNITFASIHTQSPRTRQFGGGAPGGMDDRFDMILISQSVNDSGSISYILNSYMAYGNDGNHFNDSINAPPNTAVGQEIADAIHYASDHIPLFASFYFLGPVSVETEIAPTEFMLFQNYPNPFNPTTTVRYGIPELSFVTLKIYDVLGSEIANLVNEEKPIGSYEVEFDATALTSGIYFYKLQARNYIETKKMLLMK
ncbi:MAG: T9SS type A sorting domain-containing protein [Bacteroidetes bacterium]|nr:T9SS type A sorting domain-containing protein [Bacteroidota bacterium]